MQKQGIHNLRLVRIYGIIGDGRVKKGEDIYFNK